MRLLSYLPCLIVVAVMAYVAFFIFPDIMQSLDSLQRALTALSN